MLLCFIRGSKRVKADAVGKKFFFLFALHEQHRGMARSRPPIYVLAIIMACSGGTGEGLDGPLVKCKVLGCGCGHAPRWCLRHAATGGLAARMHLALSTKQGASRMKRKGARGLVHSAGVSRGWAPRLRGGADDCADSGDGPGADAQELLFDALREQATFASFRAPLPEDIIVVPDDEVS